ncbi:polysaccharide deacetylase family protein [Aliivibrio sp. S2TY2]|uniref:polysaccharide deacetylase family protein n=1 Tax=unclassified Aliivibrio TaxID=2645654 RepID=UPI00237999D1|nr:MULTISPECIES: polysaccharide deacetylase family protein [unclassified Aliivibrio]MDD9174925.1 polysaccharide deacetylase family protein [Aliivibrio sp. S3TY1]MDD9192128.1 polysaccharide deacetylase family protein [Aliivibrio sp. S2TY2]
MAQPLTVVMYHYVRNIKESRYPQIKGLELDLFIEQLEFFAKHYHVVTMEQVLAAKYQEIPLPDKALLLTFDDAYAEHFTHVYPILKKMNMQGSFYVPAKTVLEHKVLDVNKIHFILASVTNVHDLVLSLKAEIEVYQHEYNLNSFDDYFSEFAIESRFDNKEVIFIKRMLQHVLPEKLRNIISDKLFKNYVGMDEGAFCRELYMNKYQLEQLVRDGMHVGCHGYDHYWWNKLAPEALTDELEKSKEFLASLGCDMHNWTACYPYGSSSYDVVLELEKQGCSLAVTTEVRVADLDSDHALLIPRLDTNDLPKQKNAETNHWYQQA